MLGAELRAVCLYMTGCNNFVKEKGRFALKQLPTCGIINIPLTSVNSLTEHIVLLILKLNRRGGVPMSFEAISSIAQAEHEAKTAVAAAEGRSKQMLSDAEAAGKAAVEAAGSKAEEELAELNRQAKEKAKGSARALAGELENQKAVLRSRAEARLEQAASLVVERIVNS